MNKKGLSTLEKYRKYLKLKRYSENSIRSYCFYVNQFIMAFNKPALHITSKDTQSYIWDYKYTSVSNQNQVYSALKIFTKEILGFKINKVFPERPRKEKRLPIVINKEYLLDCINSVKNKKHKAILTITFSAGLRVSEVLNLKPNNIDSKEMLINVVNGKGRKDRNVKLSENCLNVLRDYFRYYRPSEYLFEGQAGGKYSKTSCNNLVKKYIGKKYSMHKIRHSYASSLLKDGCQLRLIQLSLGHEKLDTTSIYLHTDNSFLQQTPSPC